MFYVYAVYEYGGRTEHECCDEVDTWEEAIKRVAEHYAFDKTDGTLGEYYYYASRGESDFYSYL